jgi:energy-coupling factor transporter ATP-binding protein EcfA2
VARQSEFEALQWEDFLKRMAVEWKPGEHVATIVPTGGGKTTFVGGLVKTRRYVLALDVKGGDATLRKLGWERITKWPLTREDRNDIEDGKPFRRLVGGTGMKPIDRLKRYDLCKRVLGSMLEEGGWTVVATDLKILTHPKFGGLWDDIEELTLLARERAISVITDMQRVSGQPRESTDQATWLAIGYTRDVDAVNRLGEMMGRSRAEMRGAITALGDLPYSFLVVNRDPRSPIILTRPDKL